MPPRERKPKAVKAWAAYTDSGSLRGDRTYPRRRLCDAVFGRASVQSVLILPLNGKVLMDEALPFDVDGTAAVVRRVLCDNMNTGSGKRIRVLVLDEKP